MKAFTILFLSILFLTVVLPSCEKTTKEEQLEEEREEPRVIQEAPISLDSMWQCNGRKTWDSAKVRDSLIGKWKWEYISCYYTTEKANGEDFKTLSVEFKTNDTVEVKVDNQLTQKSSWKVTPLSDGSFGLTLTPIVYQLPGRIMFCGNRVLFQDSYVDGCDNYFVRQN